jgi:outer membrane protein assembly factor BamB
MLAALVAILLQPPLDAECWPHWRGPQANGHADKASPPLHWDGGSGKNIQWKAPLTGKGSATPVVCKNRIFVVSAEKTDREAKPSELPEVRPGLMKMTNPPKHFYRFLVTCFDRTTGKQLWQKQACEAVPHEGHHETHGYAGGSPATDGERLFVSFGSYGIYCYDFEGGLIWEQRLAQINTRRGWGEAVPVVHHQGNLLLNWDQEVDSALYCLDALTGTIRWKAERDEVTTWTTPLVTEYQDKTQVILNGTRRIRSHDLKDGKVLWSCSGMTTNAIPSALRHGDAAIIMSGYEGHQAVSVPLASKGDLGTEGTVNWRYSTGTSYVPSPIIVDGLLYFTAKNNNILTILEADSGKPVLKDHRLSGTRQFYSSPLYAGGRLYFTDRDGVTVVLEPGKEAKLLATNKLGEGVDASLITVGKQMIIRGEKNLFCIGE